VVFIYFIFRPPYALFFLSPKFPMCSASALRTQLRPRPEARPVELGPPCSTQPWAQTCRWERFCLHSTTASNNDTFNTNILVKKKILGTGRTMRWIIIIIIIIIVIIINNNNNKNTGALMLTKERQQQRWEMGVGGELFLCRAELFYTQSNGEQQQHIGPKLCPVGVFWNLAKSSPAWTNFLSAMYLYIVFLW